MDTYDIAILGAGAGAKMIWGSSGGRSVAVVEQARVGGECPFVACVPSKAMLRSVRVWQTTENPDWSTLFPERVPGSVAYQEAVRRRDRIVHGRDDSGSATALGATGATLLRGHGRVRAPGVLEVVGAASSVTEIGFRDLVLNTGSEPIRPQIRGLDTIPVWTSDEALSTSDQPGSITVIGGGPVGCELAFLFAAFGSRVQLVQRNERLVPREEPEASATLVDTLAGQGVALHLKCQVARAEPHGSGGRLTLDDGRILDTDVVVLATGRRPRSADLGLEGLGVALESSGAVPVDSRGRVVGTENVWAVGDITGVAPFTHTAHYQGRVVAANLTGRPTEADYRAVPRAVYVSPTLASVGHTVASARAAGLDPVVARNSMDQTVRAATEGADEGWLMLLADGDSGTLLGATGIGGHAEEWISEASLAIRARIPVPVAADVVHPFPTFSEVLENPLRELVGKLAG
ncbi:dihydrolipoyl dehydrogenase family protein [Streptomyces sp. NPDC001698]|uniref:dihydrolipoyl dehydrogenase family protein n=1 Tax=Streptomyces sp. NPDC001698 TaxID=3364601 RepID=UPI003675EA58